MPEGILPDEDFNIDNLDQSSRDFLEAAIKDYNAVFNTNFDTSSDKFENYYITSRILTSSKGPKGYQFPIPLAARTPRKDGTLPRTVYCFCHRLS